MWLTAKKLYYDLLNASTEAAKLRVENIQFRESLVRERTNVDWLRVRVNQLELERSALMSKATGVFVPTPTITREFREPEDEKQAANDLSAMDMVGREADE